MEPLVRLYSTLKSEYMAQRNVLKIHVLKSIDLLKIVPLSHGPPSSRPHFSTTQLHLDIFVQSGLPFWSRDGQISGTFSQSLCRCCRSSIHPASAKFAGVCCDFVGTLGITEEDQKTRVLLSHKYVRRFVAVADETDDKARLIHWFA